MSTEPTVELYRSLIRDPRHDAAALPDVVVQQYLQIAISVHQEGTWGLIYPQAMVFYAAHVIERTPGALDLDAVGGGQLGAEDAGQITSQKDDTFQISRAPVRPGSTAKSAHEADLETTVWGMRYLALRSTRAATAPFRIL